MSDADLMPNPETALANCAILRAQNDAFRTSLGTDPRYQGRVMMTPGILQLSPEAQERAWDAIVEESVFDDNDPFEEHGSGSVEVTIEQGPVTLCWKIDCYDLAYEFGSEDPTDPGRTRRVLTLCFPSEY
ncbi:DUF3768 domain-containing protein [Roseobacter sp. HKCCA0434]|uniref:DUF3768 domain-containing protein n=1 Tax=Roseobacter sp. HKCCA0434 TaxID=3079297 RepID=UPI002905D01C|nr:DUF3768 domain-containing protein [Roseobacter sp. HKCCA0434]